MFTLRRQKTTLIFLAFAILFSILLAPLPRVRAADHAESTSVADDPGADLGDSFIFLNPTDNTKVVLAMTVAGFIVPGEMVNLGYFPSSIVYRFEIENTGDALPDRFIDVQFSEQTSRSAPQTASIYLNGIERGGTVSFTAPTTVPTLSATPPPFTITTHAQSGARFFAGLTDDPFYFDIPAFARFVASVGAGAPNPALLQRGRDAFAGYNCHTIAIELPVSALRGSGNTIGLNAVTLRRTVELRTSPKAPFSVGTLRQVDRAAIPAVNTALIPFPRKNEFNASTTVDDANGRFANSIIATLQSLGTNQSNISILAAVAVTNGDILRLDPNTPNTSIGFGERATTPGYTGFPNGRRTGDDTIDVLGYFITNQGLTMFDNVNSNDVPIPNTFPFFAPPQQPREPGVIDDNTRAE